MARMVKPINLYFSFEVFFFSFSNLSTPKLSNPAFSINFSICKISNNFSSYSILALFIIRLTDACLIPSCLFKYFSSPLEQALHVIPSIFKRTFFMILCSFLNVILPLQIQHLRLLHKSLLILQLSHHILYQLICFLN